MTNPPILRHPSQIGRLPWRRLLVGLVLLAVVITSAVLVLVLADIGGVRGATIPVYTALGEAREIIPNTEVWLHGERIGTVRSVEFRAVETDPDARVLVTLDVLERARPHVRRDAIVQIRPGESFLGAPVLYLSRGSPSAPAVRAGDTLRSSVRLDPDELSAAIRGGFSDARAVLENVRRTAAAVRSARGSIAALIGSDTAADLSALRQVRASLARLTSRDGSLPALLGDETLRERLGTLRLRLDTLVASSAEGSARLAVEDDSLREAASHLSAELAVLREQVRERLTSRAAGADSTDALQEELARLDTALDALVRDLRRRPWRYVGF